MRIQKHTTYGFGKVPNYGIVKQRDGWVISNVEDHTENEVTDRESIELNGI